MNRKFMEGNSGEEDVEWRMSRMGDRSFDKDELTEGRDDEGKAWLKTVWRKRWVDMMPEKGWSGRGKWSM